MLSVTEARDQILAAVSPLGTERVDLLAAVGMILREDILATRQQPPWDNSAMDGYALRAEDCVGASRTTPVTLTVVEEIRAGQLPQHTLQPGQAARIMTGAPLPPGADVILRQEDTNLGMEQVQIFAAPARGQDIRKAGEDHEVGDLLISSGQLLRPAEIGLLAGTRRTRVGVSRKPRVAILSTGDELCEPDEVGHGGQIVNTNAYALAAQVMEAGAIPTLLPIAADTRESLRLILAEALTADVVISSGGVSVGTHDYVKEVLEELGVQMGFWRIRMTPGKPLAFGQMGSRLVFGLPGNPVSSLVTFELFVRPALLKLTGRRDLFRRCVLASMEETTPKRAMPHFLRVKLRQDGDGQWVASSTGPQGSGILRSMSLADGLAFAPGDLHVVPAGSSLWVMGLDHHLGTSNSRPF